MIILAFVLLLLIAPGDRLVVNTCEAKSYRDTHKLLDAMADVRSDNDKLAALFKVGDERIRDLVNALNDPARDISLRAQIVIRYLGNLEGMQKLTEWYSKQPNQYPVAGPIPLPLSSWDHKFINLNLIGKAPNTWGDRGVQYIYALALDDAQESKTALDTMIKGATDLNERTFVWNALKQVQQVQSNKLLLTGKDLPELVVEHAFFMSRQDHKQASARLLGLNGTNDKALVEVYISRGRLAEEWYHVVLRKSGDSWEFFSITRVAVS